MGPKRCLSSGISSDSRTNPLLSETPHWLWHSEPKGDTERCFIGLKALSNAWVKLMCRCPQNSRAGGMTGVVAFIFPRNRQR